MKWVNWRELLIMRLSLQRVVEDNDEKLYHAVFAATVLSNLLRNALHYTERGSCFDVDLSQAYTG